MVSPVDPKSRTGNGMTARRWAGLLRKLGHRVDLVRNVHGRDPDCVIALHAWKSAGPALDFAADHPDRPLIVGMAGTDLYRDIRTKQRARRTIEEADRLVVLQAEGVSSLPARLRKKARVIYQSVTVEPKGVAPRTNVFEVAVVAHLRPVKDPLRAAMASRRLPKDSRIEVVHAGRALTESLERRAAHESDRNPRYRWLGDTTHAQVLRLIERSRVLVLSSRSEGGANVLGEALALGTPVIASKIDGSVGILGRDYPGYFPVGDTRALAALMLRAEQDERFYARLMKACAKRKKLVSPQRERAAWKKLLAEL